MIQFEHVSKVFANGVEAVCELSLTIEEGETLALLGTSGSGKTTTMKMINRLVEPSAGRISNEKMQQLNYEVDERGRKPANVAREYLVSEGLISEDARAGSGDAGTVTIGSKAFTEQEILGEMMALVLEVNTELRVVRRLNLEGTMICFNALRAGDLDLYAEYTGTGLVNILQREVISDSRESYRLVKEVFEKEYGLIWLSPFGFNNTYTLTMRREQAEKLGIDTISDLAGYLSSGGSGSGPSVPVSSGPLTRCWPVGGLRVGSRKGITSGIVARPSRLHRQAKRLYQK